MIDFRYHLVSIVSIFLALAVGIVLGAGPLKEDIGNSLTTEVGKLRDDKAALRTEVDAATEAAKARDEFTAAGNRTLLADRLSGTTIAVVVLPGADGNLVRDTTSTLTAAGATIGSTVTVLDSWVDADKQTFRATLAEQLAPGLGIPVEGGEGQLMDAVLARALLTKAGSDRTGVAAAMEGLRTGELVRYTPDQVRAATGAVVISGPVTGGDAAERDTKTAQLSGLSGALDAAGSGGVLVSATPARADTPQKSVVGVSRQNADQSKLLSTVDDAEIPMGQASIVFALVEQLAGKVGQYGLQADATAAFPALATK